MHASTEEKRRRLFQIIREKSFREKKDGYFQLASGAQSRYFFDLKATLLDPEGATLSAEIVLDMLKDEPMDAFGGLELGACPLVSAVCVKSLGVRPLKAFYVRKEKKGRGTEALIEGAVLAPGDNIVVADDVTTSGGSTLAAVDNIEKALGKCRIAAAVSVVDREKGATENFAKRGIRLFSIFKESDFAKP